MTEQQLVIELNSIESDANLTLEEKKIYNAIYGAELENLRSNNRIAMLKDKIQKLRLEIINDIIENNATFQVPSLGYYGGEIHYEAVKGEDFKKLRAKGKFSGIDFLETLFTGYQLYLFLHGKRDNFLARRKYPIYISKFLKQKMENLVNQGKTYC